MGVSAAPRSPEKRIDQPVWSSCNREEAGSQNVAGAFQFEAHTVGKIEGFTVFEAPRKVVDVSHDAIGCAFGHRRKLHGVRQHGGQERLGGMGADDFALELPVDQLGYTADMVDVSVGEEQVVNLVRRDGPLVHGLLGIVSLGQAAIDHDVEAV